MKNLEKATSFETLTVQQMKGEIIERKEGKWNEFFIQITDHHDRKKIIAKTFDNDKKGLRIAQLLLSKNASSKWFDLTRMNSTRGHDWMISMEEKNGRFIIATIQDHESMLLCQKLIDAKNKR
jgi:hypothetical protein